MKISLTCALLLVVSLAEGASKPCAHILPGLERMSRGIDITRLDLFPSDLSVDIGLEQVLFDFTCDNAITWSHPTVKDFKFPLPDQIATVNTIPGGALNHKVTFHQDVQELKKTLGVHVGLDANTIQYGDYSLSVGYKRAQEQLLEHNETIVEVAAYVSAVQMDFKPHRTLKPNANFANYVNNLESATYEADSAKFDEFVDTFGTHYFESGIFGGYLLQQTIIQNDYLYKHTTQEVSTNVQASYLQMIKAKVEHDQTKDESQRQFEQSTTTNYYYYGGKANLIDAMKLAKFSDWWDSVPSDPWLFGGRIRPIEDLVEQAATKQQVKRAVEVKLLKAYLQELRYTVFLVKRDAAATEIQSIDKLLGNAKSLTRTQVAPIGKAVEALVVKAQRAKDEAYLRNYSEQLDKVLGYELFCKKEVANRCFHEKRHEVNDAIDEVKKLKARIAHTLADMSAASAEQDTSEQARALIHEAMELVHEQQTKPLGQCKEKLFCNLCKDVVVDIIKHKPCDSTHIKQLLNVHL